MPQQIPPRVVVVVAELPPEAHRIISVPGAEVVGRLRVRQPEGVKELLHMPSYYDGWLKPIEVWSAYFARQGDHIVHLVANVALLPN